MTPKAMAKYHSRALHYYQLYILFNQDEDGQPQPQGSYFMGIEGFSIREQKTFVIEPPVF